MQTKSFQNHPIEAPANLHHFRVRKEPARTPIRIQRDKLDSRSFIYSVSVDRGRGGLEVGRGLIERLDMLNYFHSDLAHSNKQSSLSSIVFLFQSFLAIISLSINNPYFRYDFFFASNGF